MEIDPTGTTVQLVEFNEAQKAAMTAALRAAADELDNELKQKNSEHKPLYAGDIIELLSDSEEEAANSDCEILGYMPSDSDNNEHLQEDVHLPLEEKIEAEECLDNTLAEIQNERNMAMDVIVPLTESDTSNYLTASVHAEDSANEADFEANNLYEAATEAQLVNVKASFTKTAAKEEPKRSIALDVPIISSVQIILPPAMEIVAKATFKKEVELPRPITIIKDDNESQSSSSKLFSTDHDQDAISLDSHYDNEMVASTFGADQFDCDDTTAVVTAAEDDDVDIIELGDSSDEDEVMDEATEKKLIELIDSDMEDEHIEQTTQIELANTKRKKTLDMLMHFICPMCEHPCGSYKKWKAHTDSTHDFRSVDKLNLHTVIRREGELCYQCRDCNHKFKLNEVFNSLLRHRIKHMPYQDYFKCRLCDSRCRTRNSLRNHLKKQHYKIVKHYLGPKPYNTDQHIDYFCPVCNEKQENKIHWTKHLELKHNFFNRIKKKTKSLPNGKFECGLCKQSFCEMQINIHALKHEPYKSFKCKLCDKYESIYRQRTELHVRNVHIFGVQERFTCRYCDEVFTRTVARWTHMHEKHKLHLLKCEVCGNQYLNSAQLLAHINESKHQSLK